MNPTRTVLLVEDDPDVRTVVTAQLHQQGYAVVALGDGDDAAERIRNEPPDLAVLDLLLPGQSGFALAELIKDQTHGRVPVIMMTANSAPAHRDFAHAVGVDVFLTKPFAPHVLLGAVRALCPLRNMARPMLLPFSADREAA